MSRRSENIAGLKPEERQQAIDNATKLVDERVLPAYRRVLALLDEVLPRTTPEAGLSRLPNGAARLRAGPGQQHHHDDERR